MENLTWFQADYLARAYGRKVRRSFWHRWILYSNASYLYYSLLPEVDPSVSDDAAEENYHIVRPTEHQLEEWFASDWTDEDWNTALPIPTPVPIPVIPPPFGPGPGRGFPGPGTPGTPALPPDDGGGSGSGSGGSGSGSGSGSGGGGSGSGSGGGGGGGGSFPPPPPPPPPPPHKPRPHDPPTPPASVSVTLSATLHPDPDTDHTYPLYWSYGPNGILDGPNNPEGDDYYVGPYGGDPYGVYIGSYGGSLCWSDAGYPDAGELIGTVTVTGGRPGTANGTIRDVAGGLHVFTMDVPGTYNFAIAVPYVAKMYYARVGMPGEHPLDLSIDYSSNQIFTVVYPKCSDIGF